MKKKLLVICFFIGNLLNAQGVYEIYWEPGITSAVASPTIQLGDTVKWIWTEASQKTVTSLPRSKENFDSGILEGKTKSFSYTFLKTGVTEYENEVNPDMAGKVTVVNKLSMEDKFVKNLSFYPNPVKNFLTISSQFKISGFQIYNVLGSMVAEGNTFGRTITIDMSELNSGLYFVKVVSNSMESSLKIAKK